MASWTQNFYHGVCVLEKRRELITPDLEERLYPFIGGIVRDLRCSLIAINGAAEHLHVLVRYRADLSNSELMQNIKARSSKWIHETFPDIRGFKWQEGFGGFTVSKSVVPSLEAYIANQKEHHARQTFKEEVLQIIRVNELDFDPTEMFA